MFSRVDHTLRGWGFGAPIFSPLNTLSQSFFEKFMRDLASASDSLVTYGAI